MPSRREGGARFVAFQFLYLLPDDVRAIEEALEARFPGLRYVRYPNLVDWRATEADPAYQAARRAQRMDYPVIASPPSTWNFEYFESMAGPGGNTGCDVWVEPVGWSPEWEKSRSGWPELVNKPVRHFHFSAARSCDAKWPGMAGPAPPDRGRDEYLMLLEGQFQGVYYPWEKETLSFLRRVRRIFAKHTSNVCCLVDPVTMRPRWVEAQGSWNRIGPHAAAWAMAHPRHFLGRDFIKPIAWTEKYPDGWRED